MGMFDIFSSKEERLTKARAIQEKRNQELRAEILLLNSEKQGKELQKELDDLRSETLV